MKLIDLLLFLAVGEYIIVEGYMLPDKFKDYDPSTDNSSEVGNVTFKEGSSSEVESIDMEKEELSQDSLQEQDAEDKETKKPKTGLKGRKEKDSKSLEASGEYRSRKSKSLKGKKHSASYKSKKHYKQKKISDDSQPVKPVPPSWPSFKLNEKDSNSTEEAESEEDLFKEYEPSVVKPHYRTANTGLEKHSKWRHISSLRNLQGHHSNDRYDYSDSYLPAVFKAAVNIEPVFKAAPNDQVLQENITILSVDNKTEETTEEIPESSETSPSGSHHKHHLHHHEHHPHHHKHHHDDSKMERSSDLPIDSHHKHHHDEHHSELYGKYPVFKRLSGKSGHHYRSSGDGSLRFRNIHNRHHHHYHPRNDEFSYKQNENHHYRNHKLNDPATDNDNNFTSKYRETNKAGQLKVFDLKPNNAKKEERDPAIFGLRDFSDESISDYEELKAEEELPNKHFLKLFRNTIDPIKVKLQHENVVESDNLAGLSRRSPWDPSL